MIQRRCRTGFLFESTETAGVGGHLLGQDFDSDFSAELEVFGLVHFTHPARAQLGEDFVVAESGAALEGHG